MFNVPLVFALNHLLGNASWARARLAPHAGQILALQGGLLDLTLRVTETGQFQAVNPESDTPTAVSITLPSTAPFLLFTNSEGLLQQAKISGNIDFAESLNFVFRNLEWDVEAELAPLLGDILARRLTQLGRALRTRLQQKTASLAAYLRDEAACLISSSQMKRFAADVQNVDAETAQVEKRLRSLEARARQTS